MIYTWTGSKVVKIKKYVTTDENIKDFINGMVVEIDIEYEDGETAHRIESIHSLRADNGLSEIQGAIK